MYLLYVKILIVISLSELILYCSAKQSGCGVPKVRRQDLIVRGQSAYAYQWPWHATIMHRSSSRRPAEYACGGSLISDIFVLTARHCTLAEGSGNPLNVRAIVVQFGVETLYEVSPSVQEHGVLRVHTVGEFCCEELRNDIALIELRTVVQLNDFVQPICLPERDMMIGEMGTVVGFGWTEQDEVSLTLRKTNLPVIETGECLRSDRPGWGGALDEGLFCAGYLNGTTVCNGDSGGGLVFKNGERWQIGGIIAFSMNRADGDAGCRHDGFGGFTKVYKYLKWIRNETGLVQYRSVNILVYDAVVIVTYSRNKDNLLPKHMFRDGHVSYSFTTITIQYID